MDSFYRLLNRWYLRAQGMKNILKITFPAALQEFCLVFLAFVKVHIPDKAVHDTDDVTNQNMVLDHRFCLYWLYFFILFALKTKEFCLNLVSKH